MLDIYELNIHEVEKKLTLAETMSVTTEKQPGGSVHPDMDERGSKALHVERKEDRTLAKPTIFSFLTNIVSKSIRDTAEYLFSLARAVLGSSEDPQLNTAKRKRSDVAGNDTMDTEEKEAEDEQADVKTKRWRPDAVFQAVEKFISNFWGERDSNENIKDEGNDENMNSFASNGGSGDGERIRRPDLDINFFSDSIISSIDDLDSKGTLLNI